MDAGCGLTKALGIQAGANVRPDCKEDLQGGVKPCKARNAA